MTQITARIPNELLALLDEAAGKLRRTRAELVRQARLLEVNPANRPATGYAEGPGSDRSSASRSAGRLDYGILWEESAGL